MPDPLVPAAKPSEDRRPNEEQDRYHFICGMAVGEMLLQATELGLVTHPIPGFDHVMARASSAFRLTTSSSPSSSVGNGRE